MRSTDAAPIDTSVHVARSQVRPGGRWGCKLAENLDVAATLCT